MNKKLVLFAVVSVLLFQPYYSFAKSTISAPLKVAIKKYKYGNYAGCLQDCENIVVKNPSAIAYYYMAMSYVKAGKKSEAIQAYQKVLSFKPNARLAEYATTGKRCLETPDQCHLEDKSAVKESTELDKLIASPSRDGLSSTVRKDFRQIHLNNIKDEINNGKELDDYSFKKLNYNSEDKKNITKKPSNDEIVAALKVLKDAGLNPYSQAQIDAATANQDIVNENMTNENSAEGTPYAQTAINYQNNDINTLNMMVGNGNNQGNNAALNMIPFMIAQNKNGTTNYSPQMMKSVIMSSMMSNFNYDFNEDKNR